MALGDGAISAGMDIVDPEEDRRNGADEITKTRDYIAQFLNSISLTWSAITGKPSSLPPSAHGHSMGEISGPRPEEHTSDIPSLMRLSNDVLSSKDNTDP